MLFRSPHFGATGQDMTRFEIVKAFVETQGKARVRETKEFNVLLDKEEIAMLGTYSPVPALEWAVIAQKPQREAYRAVNEMQRAAQLLALFAVLASIAISVFASRKITSPLKTLTESSRAIAKGDFSQRVRLKSRTEIGELAEDRKSVV